MDYQFRPAKISEAFEIWQILKDAIQRRKEDGSNQWQDGYPNMDVVKNDIERKIGFVLTQNDNIIGYTAVIINNEPDYINIEGKWLTNQDFMVYHRVAISKKFLAKGMAKKMMKLIEEYALSKNIYSLKADTNHDNIPMLKIFEKMGYSFCGTVHIRQSPRKAYEKVLKN
ncbi:GNAT family N-acetyltransferase [Flavobacteriales bacterium]|jgi:RimJ/RimL family protein N-acetyltransferase|nr:GNAT family N-acetyltransferase [Flavobacteriales bacterium]